MDAGRSIPNHTGEIKGRIRGTRCRAEGECGTALSSVTERQGAGTALDSRCQY